MSLEDRIRNLCQEIVACQDESDAVVLAEELQIVLHECVDQLRGKVMISPSLIEKLKHVKAA